MNTKRHSNWSARCLGIASLALFIAVAATSSAEEGKYEPFDYANFENPTRIDNPWFPLVPGTRFIYEGSDLDDEGEPEPHRLEVHVTDLVKVIDGIRSVVTWDLDYSEGDLVEAELAFYAQDDDGTVWRMGEHPEEYEDGKLIEAPGWMAGFDGAKAGIAMRAEPKAGTPGYSQGWAPSVGFTDRGKVERFEAEAKTPVGTFTNVLVIAEGSAEEGPDAEQLKYYARGVGEIKVGWRGSQELQQEAMELVSVSAMDPEELARVGKMARELEKHANQISKVYAQTLPLEATSETTAWTMVAKLREPIPETGPAIVRKVTNEQAKAIALQTVPGEVTDIAVERKMGKKTIVVEVIAAADMSETDVIIDMETGAVLGTEK